MSRLKIQVLAQNKVYSNFLIFGLSSGYLLSKMLVFEFRWNIRENSC